VVKILPDRPEPPLPAHLRARHLEPSLLGTPALALNLAKVEILRLGQQVKAMTEAVIEPLCGRHPEQLAALDEAEERVDALDDQITGYLLEIGRRNLSPEQTEEVYLMLHVTKLFELSSDVIHRELKPLAQQKDAAGILFSAEGEGEVRAYHLKVVKQIARALDAFREGSLAKARRMTHKQAKYVALEESFRRAHFERVRGEVSESVASSELHIALMDSLRKINSHSADIARAMLTRFARDAGPERGAGGSAAGEPR
jgi:phosphate:Na+ symporter